MNRIHLSACKELSKDVSYIPNMAADYLFKPNGLWYATNDEWFEWIEEMKAQNHGNYISKFILEIDFSDFCILQDIYDVIAFHRKYSYNYDYGFRAINWESVKKDYSGIEIRDYHNLNFASSLRAIIWMRNWAMDSGCIWDMSAVEWRKIAYN